MGFEDIFGEAIPQPTRKSVFDRLSGNADLSETKKEEGGKCFAEVVGKTDSDVLSFFPLENKVNSRVLLPLELTKEAMKVHHTTLYGYFLGSRIPFPVVEGYVKQLWGKFGFVQAMMNNNGIMFFKFNDLGGCNQVLASGPLMIRGVPMFVAQWDPLKGLSKPIHTTCPLWVKLHNVPLVAFNKEGISRIASALGVPKQMDACTASMCDKAWGRPGFAKVLVEVWAIGELKRELEVVIPNLGGGEGSVVTIKVEYIWEPVQCSHCLVFGHKVNICTRAPKVQSQTKKNSKVDSEGFVTVERKQWKPKQTDKPSSSGTSNVGDQGATVGSARVTNLPNTSGSAVVIDSAKLPGVSELPTGGLTKPNEGSARPNQDSAKPKEVETTHSEVPAKPSDVVDDSLDAWDQFADPPEFSMPLNTDFVRTSRGVPEGSFRPPVNTVPKFTARRGQFVPKSSTVDSASANVFSPLANLGDKDAGGGDSAASSGVAVNKGKGSADRTSSGWQRWEACYSMIHAACWNIRGLNSPEKQREVKSFLRDHNINLFAVLESHLSSESVVSVVSNVFGRWMWVSNQSVSLHGTRIIIAWDADFMDVMVLESHAQFMHCEIRLHGDMHSWFCSVAYGANSGAQRRSLWSGLRKFKACLGDQPWVVMGDFNAMLFPHDALGGVSKRNGDMIDFFECLQDVELFDVVYSGIQYSWCQKPKEESGIRRKLDRVLANVDFTSVFPDARVRFLPRGISDHAPSVLSFKGGLRKKKFGFRFDNFLVEHPRFLQIVKHSWAMHSQGSFMFRLLTKLKALKTPLRRLRSTYGNLSEKVNSLKNELDVVQLACDMDPFNDELKQDLEALRGAYQQALRDENLAARQRAKVKWLKEGDSNTRFFHNTVKEKRHVQRIQSVCDMGGTFVYDDDVGLAFIEHFTSFLGKRDDSLQHILEADSFEHRISFAVSLEMIRPILDSDIKNAMFEIGNDKAPGSDGFSSRFFKAAWEVVGNDVSISIHNFFYDGRLLKELNHTLICLLPKIPNATSVSDYRPIACCSVLYKCISKIIVDRMKPVLDGIVNKSQSAFIPGRRIVDNILMAHELVVGYHLNVGPPRCAFKIDLRKAYDMVDWGFLIRMLEGFGFHHVLVKWIKELVTTTSYSVMINGEQRGFFKGERGIRQGDPLSPYLFTLIMEGFSMIFKRCIQEAADFGYHPGCEGIELTHLCFADDLFVFTAGDVASVEILKKALSLFGSCSGLAPNLLKSDIFFGNVPDHDRSAILNCLSFRMGNFPIRYLGVPLSPTFLKVADYGGLIAKVKARISNWKSKHLSFGGRKQLIISVLQSLQLYWMAVFVFPSAVIQEIESLLRAFLWTQGEVVNGRCRIAWDSVTKPKEHGGLGFKRLSSWNRALIARNLWDILSKRDTMWVRWVFDRYLGDGSFWTSRSTLGWSWTLRKMWNLRDAIRPFIRSVIGNGCSTNAWQDTWLACGPLVVLLSYRRIHASGFSVSTTVHELLDTIDGWPPDWVARAPQLEGEVLPTLSEQPDSVQWVDVYGKPGSFSVSCAYASFDGVHQVVPWSKFVWFPGHIPKHAFCLWIACYKRHPTQDRMMNWKHDPPDWKCGLCGVCMDSHNHLFFECQFSSSVWNQIRINVDWRNVPSKWDDMVDFLATIPMTAVHLKQKLALAATVYALWRERNRRIFTDEKRNENRLIKEIMEIVLMRMAWKKLKKDTHQPDVDS
ncbi:hypothetical protein OSB04_un000353 [Centaurea solstitialis]|uniref:Reverse transcriptase domain-containing protein n=1 Tax=Centaurea solstitialis TaxID=347529 RepID=A0AA38SNT6_9ASTR|nr:hypothetical protein OSB04_un000353 [Centaurea solstitialis]